MGANKIILSSNILMPDILSYYKNMKVIKQIKIFYYRNDLTELILSPNYIFQVFKAIEVRME